MANKLESGQSLIEVIIASLVGILVVSALTFATIFSLRNANFAKNSAQATKLAQEGIERVRTGRDKNQCISALDTTVKSWNDNSSNINCPGPGSIWAYPITGSSNNCENTTLPGSKCYFTVDSAGVLTNIGYAFVPTSTAPLPPSSELIPYGNLIFKRAVILSDDSLGYTTQKKVTIIVGWNDATGNHESELTTILRKL